MTSYENLQLEIGKAMVEYQKSFVDEKLRKEKYNQDLQDIDIEFDMDNQKIIHKRKQMIHHLAQLMEVATQAVQGKDIVLAKLATEEPTKQTYDNMALLLKKIKDKKVTKKSYFNDPLDNLWS